MPESIMDFMHSDKILLVSARFNKHEVGGGGGGAGGLQLARSININQTSKCKQDQHQQLESISRDFRFKIFGKRNISGENEASSHFQAEDRWWGGRKNKDCHAILWQHDCCAVCRRCRPKVWIVYFTNQWVQARYLKVDGSNGRGLHISGIVKQN